MRTDARPLFYFRLFASHNTVLCAILAADSSASLARLMACVFVSNLAASVQDVAVDGWAIDMLSQDDMAAGNVAQVVGFKVGMLLSGGILPWLADLYGYDLTSVFYALAAWQL